jgi:tRNA/tmRNA/rRNA uracil-C5-methylase (TrmA/RlmC/RlmD family)
VESRLGQDPLAGRDGSAESAPRRLPLPERAPERIVYISCNPATLARNVKDFTQHGWRQAEGTPFDRFPHTLHIECVTSLVWG